MKKKDYVNSLDKIKCRPEFKRKMLEQLSESADTGADGSVERFERSRSISYHWGAMAASLLLIVGIGGGALALKNSPESAFSELSSELAENNVEAVCPYTMNATMNHVMLSADTNNPENVESVRLGELPDELAAEIYDRVRCALDIAESDDNGQIDSKNDDFIAFSMTNDDEQINVELHSGGMVRIYKNGSPQFFRVADLYWNVVDLIGRYLPYCDWESILSATPSRVSSMAFLNSYVVNYNVLVSKKRSEIAQIFEEHRDEIKRTHRSDLRNGRSIILYCDNNYRVTIYSNGTIYVDFEYPEISVDSDYSYRQYEAGLPAELYSRVVSNRQYIFTSSPELYSEILEIGVLPETMAVQLDSGESNDIFSELNRLAEDGVTLCYQDNESQSAVRATISDNAGIRSLVGVAQSMVWEEVPAYSDEVQSYIRNNFLVTNNIRFASQPIIYKEGAQTAFIARDYSDEQYAAYRQAMDDIIKADTLGYMVYLIASNRYNFSNMQADYSVYCDSDGENSTGGTGTIKLNSNYDSRIHLAEGETVIDYSRDMSEWTMNTNADAEHSSEGNALMESPVYDYDQLRRTVLWAIRDYMNAEPEERGFDFVDTKNYIDCDLKFVTDSVDDNTIGTEMSLRVDRRGTIIGLKYEFTVENKPEMNMDIEMRLGDGSGDDMIYDSSEFSLE